MFFPPVCVLNESAKGPLNLLADMLWQKSPFRLIFHNLTQTSFLSAPGMNRICYFSFPFWTLTDSGFPQQLAWLSLLWALANRTPNLSPILSDVSRVPDSVSNLLTGQRIWLAGVFDQEKSGYGPALPAIHFHFSLLKRPLRESNPQLELRRPLFYPLN
jgi:hypothetical protein